MNLYIKKIKKINWYIIYQIIKNYFKKTNYDYLLSVFIFCIIDVILIFSLVGISKLNILIIIISCSVIFIILHYLSNENQISLITIIRLNFDKNYQIKYFRKSFNIFNNINIIYSLHKKIEQRTIELYKIGYNFNNINILNPRFEFVQELLLINSNIIEQINPKCSDYRKIKELHGFLTL